MKRDNDALSWCEKVDGMAYVYYVSVEDLSVACSKRRSIRPLLMSVHFRLLFLSFYFSLPRTANKQKLPTDLMNILFKF